MINHHYNFLLTPWVSRGLQGMGGGGISVVPPHGGGRSGEFNRETIQILQSLSLTPLPLPGDKY